MEIILPCLVPAKEEPQERLVVQYSASQESLLFRLANENKLLKIKKDKLRINC